MPVSTWRHGAVGGATAADSCQVLCRDCDLKKSDG